MNPPLVTVATSTALPTSCPVCGYAFGAATADVIAAHLLAHLLMQTGVASRDTSKADW